MTHSGQNIGAAPPPGGIAEMRLRGRSGPLCTQLYWPATADVSTMLVFFALGCSAEGDALLPDLCVDPGLLVLRTTCTTALDAIAVAEWSADHAAELGATPSLLFVAGQGAGGRPAAGVALRARDRRWPVIARQILIDPHLRPVDNAPADPYAAPLGAPSVADVAPATVVTTGRGTDPVDGRSYADRLRRANVEVDEITLRGPEPLLAAIRPSLSIPNERKR